MVMSRLSRLTLVLAILLALLPTPALAGPPTHDIAPVWGYLPCVLPGAGSLHGRITSWPTAWPDAPVGVWLAMYWPLSDDGQSGVWVLDPAGMPWVYLDADGEFAFSGVAPGRYCLVVGTTPLYMAPVRNDYALAAVFRVEAGEDTDVGDHGVWAGR